MGESAAHSVGAAGSAGDAHRPVLGRRRYWDRFRRLLWQPPRRHGEQPHERTVGPLELFYDLAAVVLVSQAAHRFAAHLNWPGLGEFAAIFALVWIAWTNGSLHHELHGHEDARARNSFLIQVLALIAIGAFIPGAGGARGGSFALASGALFGVLAALWWLAARGDGPEYRGSSRNWIAGTIACAALLVATAFLPAGARVPAWGVIDAAYLIGFSAVLLTSPPAEAAGLRITDALIERFGLFIIIVLGETLTGVVQGLASQAVSGVTLAVGLVSVVIGFGAWWTYFDFAGQRPVGPRRSARVQWMLGHLPLAAAIAASGAAMASLVRHAHDGRTPPGTAWVLCGGVALVLCATVLVFTSLEAWHTDRRFYRPVAVSCGLIALVSLCVAAVRPAPLVLGVVLVVLLSIPWVHAVLLRLGPAGGPPARN